MGTTPGGGFPDPQPDQDDEDDDGDGDTCTLHPEACGIFIPNLDPEMTNESLPPLFAYTGSIVNTMIDAFTLGPAWCEVIDCVLSAVSILASGLITAVPEVPQVVGIAFAVDLVVTGWAVLRTNEDYAQGEISQERQWILNGTGIIGVLPIPYVGLGLSIVNGMVTFSGYPP
jgi:hypothetical protein